MSEKDGKRLTAGRRKRLALATLAALALSLSAVSSASALSFEGVSTWASTGEEVQLGGVAGMAVNVNGAGGVPPGTYYAIVKVPGSPLHVMRFGPEEKLVGGWEVRTIEGAYEQCGPTSSPCSPRESGEVKPFDVDVDQVTGDVYVDNAAGVGEKTIIVYNATGTEVITRFGEVAPGSDKTETSPAKIHESPASGAIAVNSDGEVYVYDRNTNQGTYSRLMVFRPKTPGDFSEYVYAGEIAGRSPKEGKQPTRPVVDAAGNIYATDESTIEEYAPEEPGAFPHPSTPVCSFEYSKGGITAITVNPESGELFFFSYKNPKRIHQLAACESGEFQEIGTIEVKPERDDLYGLAYDPQRQFSEGRPLGVLYGGAPGPTPTSGVGTGEPGKTSLGYSFAPAQEAPPVVEDESVAEVTSTSAHLLAEVNPRNFQTRYAFQYLPRNAYEANEPAERQEVTVSATGGVFRLGFEGNSTGGSALATLTAGSPVVSSVLTGKGTANVGLGSSKLTSVTISVGDFEVGQSISGAGIPANTKVVAVEPGKLVLSAKATASGAAVAISSAGPMPLAVGQQIEGPGVAAGTSIVDAKPGQLTLSAPAIASGVGVTLQAGISSAATAGDLQRALQRLPSLGTGNALVSGGPGDEAGSSPYQVTFAGALGDSDLPPLSADSSHLSGGPASAAVSTDHEGGSGFASGAIESPSGGAVLGEGGSAIAAGTTLSGLTQGTSYYYRVIATSHCSPGEPSKVCEAIGPDQFFRTYSDGGQELPDGRAYELVSPPQKNGGQVFPAEPSTTSCIPVECKPGDAYQHFPMQSSPNGDAIVYEGSSFFPGQGAIVENEYISRRTPTGWNTTNLTPGTLLSKGGQGYKAFDPSLSAGILEQITPALAPEAPPGFVDLYRQQSGSPGQLTPLLREEPASPNHLPFSRLAGEGPESLKLVYAGASSDLSRLFFEANDALTGVTPFAPEAVDGGASKKNLYEWDGGTLSLVNVGPHAETAPGAAFGAPGFKTPYAISTDGTRVFWSSEAGQTYMRIDGTETRELEAPGKFLTASADGSRALLSTGCLYDLEEEKCQDLTGGHGGFQGIAGQSNDLSHIYFVDSKALTGENAGGRVPNEHGEGEDNLYAWSESAPLEFVGTLLPGDSAAWNEAPSLRMAEASPNGRWLTFLSKAPLTGYDNVGPCGVVANEILTVPCKEAFLYDAATGVLMCASCSPADARPLGGTVLRLIKSSPSSLPQPRYLSNSGRLYFDTQDSLTPADTNGNVEDVYQFEPAGIGSCERTGGCTAMISSGRGSVDSNFLAMDEGGANVFFTSRDQLVPSDTDDLIDLYDARVEGGIPTELQLPQPGCGEGCQASTSVPVDPPPSTLPPGSGNVKRCKKGQVEKKDRCVRKAKKKHKAKRSSHARGGAK